MERALTGDGSGAAGCCDLVVINGWNKDSSFSLDCAGRGE